MSSAPLLQDDAAARDGPARQDNTNDTVTADSHSLSLGTSHKRKWIRPSPAWILGLTAIAAISTSGTVAPRVEIYTRTVCHAHGLDSAGCMSDPVVGAAAAQLMAILATVSGTLSMLTAAWWGSLSDCFGRIGVLGFNVTGLMVSDISFLIVANFWEKLPGTYWWFAVGPISEGLVGGISVASIVMHAYISDCSDPTARSRAFSQLLGLLFIGMSIGPLLTGYIMRATGLLLPVFYATAAIDTIVTLGVWFVMPESLSPEEMQKRRKSRAEELRAMSPLRRWGNTFDIVSPLAVLLPRKREGSTRKLSFDWTMTILGAAFGFGTMVQAALYQQIQYAASVFHWSSSTVSYWLGAYHIAKAVYLTVLFPGMLKLFAWWWSDRHGASPESQPLLTQESGQQDDTSSTKKTTHVAFLDLLLARAAIVTDIVFYALTFSTTSGALFAVFTAGISFGTSFTPTMQSLALDLYERHGGADTGRVLGALTVISALSSHIVGPAVFGLTYMKTVATVPGAFYLVCCATLTAALLLLMFIQLRETPGPSDEDAAAARVHADAAADPAEEGRQDSETA